MSKIQKIGNVTLNFTYYDGADQYSDGDASELELLELAKNGSWNEELKKSSKWHILYHYSDIRNNILRWYPFKKKSSLLEIGAGCGALSGMLCEKVERVIGVELSERRSLINAYRNKNCDNLEILVGNFDKIEFEERFDYITLIGVLEYAALYVNDSNPYETFLNKIKSLLNPGGKIFIAIENKMGMKYLNGAKEDHLGIAYAGIEDYQESNIRTFSKPELEKIIMNCDITDYSFYYPYPDYKLPETIYGDKIMPHTGDVRIWGKNYDRARMATFNDAIFADQICSDKMFGYMSNSFLVITGTDEDVPDYVHFTNTRKPEYQTETIINYNAHNATKLYLNDKRGRYDIFTSMITLYGQLDEQYPNVQYLKPEILNGELVYSYIEGESLESKLYSLRHDTKELIREFRRIIDEYYKANDDDYIDFNITDDFKELFGDVEIYGNEKSVKHTNLDMLLHNLIEKDGMIYCIDYEWIATFPIPYTFLIYRIGMDFYRKYNIFLSKKISLKSFLKELGVPEENYYSYEKMYLQFSDRVYGDWNYLRNYCKPTGTLSIKGL